MKYRFGMGGVRNRALEPVRSESEPLLFGKTSRNEMPAIILWTSAIVSGTLGACPMIRKEED